MLLPDKWPGQTPELEDGRQKNPPDLIHMSSLFVIAMGAIICTYKVPPPHKHAPRKELRPLFLVEEGIGQREPGVSVLGADCDVTTDDDDVKKQKSLMMQDLPFFRNSHESKASAATTLGCCCLKCCCHRRCCCCCDSNKQRRRTCCCLSCNNSPQELPPRCGSISIPCSSF